MKMDDLDSREEALQPTQHNTPNTLNALDTIYRQAAIALLENLFKNTIVEFGYNSYEEANDRIKLLCDGVSDAMEVIETMDSAQPDLQPTCNQLATDCISRRAAIGLAHKNYDTILDFKSDGRTVADSFEDIINTLPSAQPEPIRINLNEPIKVKLTDWGKEIYYRQYDRTNQIAGREVCKPRFPKEDENGYTEFQLWCFIELYGEHIGMTLPNVIKPIEIVYERRE